MPAGPLPMNFKLPRLDQWSASKTLGVELQIYAAAGAMWDDNNSGSRKSSFQLRTGTKHR